MLRKILITFIVVFTFGIVALASNIFDTSTIEAEKTDRKLIKTYVYNLETEFADVGMVDIDAGLDDTYFVWIDSTTPNAPIYYRVFNPAVWIEFNNEGGDGGSTGRRGGGARDGWSRRGDGRGSNLEHIHTLT